MFLASPLFQAPQPPNFRVRSIGDFVAGLAQLLFLISGVVFFVLLLWGAIDWLTSGGDTQKIQAARSKLAAALVGLSIVALAFAITELIEFFFGVPITVSGPNRFLLPVGY